MKEGADSVVILGCMCTIRRRRFGVRMESRGRDVWEATWTFPIKDGAGSSSDYASEVAGTFLMNQSYRGCPSCNADSLFLCHCGTIACIEGGQTSATCPTCGERVELQGEATRVSAYGDA